MSLHSFAQVALVLAPCNQVAVKETKLRSTQATLLILIPSLHILLNVIQGHQFLLPEIF